MKNIYCSCATILNLLIRLCVVQDNMTLFMSAYLVKVKLLNTVAIYNISLIKCSLCNLTNKPIFFQGTV